MDRTELVDRRQYTQSKVAELAGWEGKALQTFVSRGDSSSTPTTNGTGDWRRYSVNHAIGFAAFAALIDIGLPPRLVHRLAHPIDFAVQLSADSEWLVIRKVAETGGKLVTGLPGWIGVNGYEAIGVSSQQLPQALTEAGDGTLVLRWNDIRHRVLTRAATMAQEK